VHTGGHAVADRLERHRPPSGVPGGSNNAGRRSGRTSSEGPLGRRGGRCGSGAFPRGLRSDSRANAPGKAARGDTRRPHNSTSAGVARGTHGAQEPAGQAETMRASERLRSRLRAWTMDTGRLSAVQGGSASTSDACPTMCRPRRRPGGTVPRPDEAARQFSNRQPVGGTPEIVSNLGLLQRLFGRQSSDRPNPGQMHPPGGVSATERVPNGGPSAPRVKLIDGWIVGMMGCGESCRPGVGAS
jgi:hypothetical protein